MSTELAILGADTANQQAGGNSFFDNATMFTGSAVLSGLSSIYNTFVEYGNMAGLDAEQIDVSRVLESYDQNWYKYYKDNQQLVDTVGFVAGSFIPGGLAIKGLKAVQAGRATGAIGRAVNGPLSFALNKREAYLEKGLKEIATVGGSAYSYINANKWASMSWGLADNLLQAAAFEGAVLLTMNNSPVLADAGKTDILQDVAFGMLVGGGFGGALDAIATNRIFKDTVKKLGSASRTYDTPAYYSGLGLGIGDEAYGFVDSLLRLPKEIQSNDALLTVSNVLTKKDIQLDASKALKRALTNAEKDAIANVSLTLQKLGTDNTPEVGEAVAGMIMRMIQEGQAAGKSADDIKNVVGEYLQGLKNVEVIGTRNAGVSYARGEDLFYLAEEVDLKALEKAGNTTSKLLDMAKSKTPFDKNATAKPYKIIGDIKNLKVTATARLFQEAWEEGNDIAIIGGKVRINPKSEIVRQVTDPVLIPKRYINTRTGGVSEEATLTWADTLPSGVKISSQILDDSVLIGGKPINMENAVTITTSDPVIATARHAWLASKEAKYFFTKEVDELDTGKLERLKELALSEDDLARVVIRREGGNIKASELDIDGAIVDAKLTQYQNLLDEGVTDHRAIAYALNVEESWLERAIANGFRRTADDDLLQGLSRNTSDYLKRENFLATWESPQSLVPFFGRGSHTLGGIKMTDDGAKWFEGSVITDGGLPVVMYHGTKKVFDKFKPGDAANAIFASPDPKFAERFSGYTPFADETPYMLPVYVKSVNPFDWENSAHTNQLIETMLFQERKYVDGYGQIKDVIDSDFDTDFLRTLFKQQLNRISNWGLIEDPDIQKVIKDLGHDGFYVMEADIKNIAVYSSDQIKSVFEVTERVKNKSFEQILKEAQAAASAKGAKYSDPFVSGEVGWMQRVQLQMQAHKNAFSVVFGEDALRFMDMDTRNTMKMVDELGVGAGALSSANADYGDLAKLWAQHTGKLTHQLIQKTASANLEKIQPFIQRFKDSPKAAAELGIILNKLRLSADKFVLVTDDAGSRAIAVRDVTKVDPTTGNRYVDSDLVTEWQQRQTDKRAEAMIYIENSEAADFLETWKAINADRISKRAVLMNSRGATLGWDPDVIYAPPIDTKKFPYFAFVKIRDGHLASTSDVAMITARSAEELAKLAREIPEQYEVFFKKDTEQYFKVKNLYDSQMTLNEPRVDSSLRKQGKLGDFFPEVRAENVMEDFINYSQAADSALVRHGVETRYAQLFEELNALGKQYTEVATSQMAGTSKFYDRTAVNPFGDYVKTALDISKKSAFPLLNQLNEFVDSAGVAAYRVLVANTDRARKGIVSWQEAEETATRYGIGGYIRSVDAETAFAIANRPMDRNILREGVSKLNMFLATAGLRLDVANSIVNVISTPIMLGSELASLRSLAKLNPDALGALNKLTTISPDGTIAAPSYTKIIGQAIKNVTGPGSKELLESYRASGDVKNILLQFHEMLDQVAINPRITPSEWSKKLDAAIETGAKWTGNTWSEDFTRAVSANVMDQLTKPLVDAKLLAPQEAAAYRTVFVNRVNGNYITSQRPIVFQGTVGAAVSLFQTYVFNVMQQLLRHIENRDMRAVMTMGGLQGGLYGLNGLPFFEAVNTHLIGNAAINDGHRDIYSATTELAGKELGDWLLYGTASAFPLFGDKAPALYTRGDINPRHVSVLPISPLDIPAVDVSRRIVANIADVGRKIVGGADISVALLEGLEHNGINRPLAGFAQIVQEYSSTSKGSLISSANEFDLTVTATRMLGAKPMDESVALNTMYRQNAYRAADMERLSRLGEIVKTKLRNNQMPSSEEMQDFMKRYAAAGGNLQNYARALQRWSRDANMSVVEQMKLFHNTSYAQRLTEIMGGTTLDDFYSAQAETTEQ